MGPFTESIREDLAAAGLMPDPLPGHSSINSRGDGVDPTVTRRSADLDPEGSDFMSAGGWSVVDIRWGDGENGGLTSHRGVLHPDEYVDAELLAGMAADHMGFTVDEIRTVYRPGRPRADVLDLRSRIDARILEVSEAGGNLNELARALGWRVGDDHTCRNMERTLARARAARDAKESE